jgi:hypothetical protein
MEVMVVGEVVGPGEGSHGPGGGGHGDSDRRHSGHYDELDSPDTASPPTPTLQQNALPWPPPSMQGPPQLHDPQTTFPIQVLPTTMNEEMTAP